MASPYAPPTADEAPAEGIKPSPGWAAFMSLLLPGLGQIYVGHTLRGVLFYAAQSLALAAMFGLSLRSPWFLLFGTTSVWLGFRIGAAVDARALARRSTMPRGPVAVLVTAVLLIFGGRVLDMATRATVVEVDKIPSGGMKPTLLVGDHVLIDKSAGLPARGDQVLFEFPEDRKKNFIHRVVGMPGDTIRIDGRDVFINGEAVPKCEVGTWEDLVIFVEWLDGRPHLIGHATWKAEVSRTWTVPPRSYFMMGDNRESSHDSRSWHGGEGHGVPEDHLLGRLTGIWFSTAVADNFARIDIDVEGASLPPGAEGLLPALERCLESGPAPPAQ